MGTRYLKVSLILIIMSISVPLATSNRFYIRTLPDQPCPARYGPGFCMTLQQYINTTNSNVSMPNMDIVSLELQSGTHFIRSYISASNITSFEMYGTNAKILCNQENSSEVLQITQVILVNITGISFTSCRMTHVQLVDVLTIQDSQFIDHGPVILDRTNGIIRNTTFLNGRTLQLQRSSLLIKQSSFLSLTVDRNSSQCYKDVIENGGAIWSYNSSINVIQSAFRNNTANCTCPSSDMCGKGGAIYAQNTQLTMNESSFTGNTAVLGGGAVYAQKSSIMVLSSAFRLNTAIGQGLRPAVGGQNGGGGALFVLGGSYIYIFRSNFIENKAKTNGSSLYASGSGSKVNINESIFLNGTSAGSVFVTGNNTQLYISRSIFSNNLANTRFGGGGVIHHTGYRARMTVKDSTFNNNSANQCAVLRLTGSLNNTVMLVNSIFTNNRATGTSTRDTGGVACITGSLIYLANCSFLRNEALGDAGVLQIEKSTIFVKSSTFDNNRAGHNGGVLYTALSAVTVSINQCEFRNNKAGGDGGVIYVGRNGSLVTVWNTNFISNVATGQGGVIAIVGSQLNTNQTIIYNNTAGAGKVIGACNSSVTVEDDLIVGRTDPNNSFCTLYDKTRTEMTDTSTPTEVKPTPVAPLPMTRSTILPTDAKNTVTILSPTTTSTTATGKQDNIVMPTAPTGSNQYTTVIYATFGIAIGTCVLVLTLYIVVICIILYLCSVFKSKERIGEVNNPYVYVPMKENEHTSDNETLS